jgi:hypothetical protein
MGNNFCNFCSGPEHFIQECEVIEKFICLRKCKHNPKGKVILPSEVQVPHSIPRAWMHDHVKEWHWQNPGQTAMQIYIKVTAVPPVTAPLHVTVGWSYTSHPTSSVDLSPRSLPVRVYTLQRLMPPHPKMVIITLPLYKHGYIGPGSNAGSTSSSTAPQRQKEASPPMDKEVQYPVSRKAKSLKHSWNPHICMPPSLMLFMELSQNRPNP